MRVGWFTRENFIEQPDGVQVTGMNGDERGRLMFESRDHREAARAPIKLK
jgi:hypothetical protein